jgi:hypothetical protein
MRAQVDIWEKEQTQSAKSFAQNLEVKIKETDEKLDKLVNAFPDGKKKFLLKRRLKPSLVLQEIPQV